MGDNVKKVRVDMQTRWEGRGLHTVELLGGIASASLDLMGFAVMPGINVVNWFFSPT